MAHTISGVVHDVRYINNKVRSGANGHALQLAVTHPSDSIYNITVSNNVMYGSPGGVITGFYGSSRTASISNVKIAKNTFRDNNQSAVAMTGNLTNVVVSDNVSCNSKGFSVGPGKGNAVVRNTSC